MADGKISGKNDDIKFGDFVIKFAQNIASVNETAERLRTQTSVTLFKRFRGDSLGDRIGRWNYATNNYVEPTINTLSPYNIYTDNIVKPKVRANAATMSQAAIAVTAEPRTQTTRCKKNAMISQHICDWVDDNIWTSDKLLHLNVTKQLTQGVFVKTSWNEAKDGYTFTVDDWQDQDFDSPAQFGCMKCGAAAYTDVGTEEAQDPNAVQDATSDQMIEPPACPECGGPTEIVAGGAKESISSSVQVSKSFYGDNDIEIFPAMEFRADERYSQGGNLSKCRWLEHHPLMSKFEIETTFGIDEVGAPSDWSYPTKWLYTLQTGTKYPFTSVRETNNTIKKLELFEVRYFYFSSEWLSVYTAQSDYELVKGDTVRFSIKAGENARDVQKRMSDAEAQERQSPHKKNGLCVVLSGQKIFDIYLADFKKDFRYTYFVSDPVSFWGLPYSELEPMQHLVNQMLTSLGNQAQSQQNIAVFNREAYDADDVSGSKNYIFTRDGIDMPIKDTFDIIPATPSNPEWWTMYQQMKHSAEETSMVSKEMQGQPSEVKTFGQAQLNRDQATGVLTPAQQSTADAKVGSFEQNVILAQMHWPKERVWQLCDTTEGIITEEDVETWYKSDISSDVVFSYRAGSEMPKSFTEKRDDVAYVTNYILSMAKFVPDMVTPQLAIELINRVTEYSALDGIDVQNSETDVEVAEIRYTIIVEGLEENLQGQLSTPQEHAQVVANALQQTLANPVLIPLKQENHQAAIEFYRDKCLYEYKKETPNLVLVGALQEMIDRHIQAYTEQGQKVVQTALAIHPPPHPFAAVHENVDINKAPADVQQQFWAQNGVQMDPNAMNAAPPAPPPSVTDQQKVALDVAKVQAENTRTQTDAQQVDAHKALDLTDAAIQRTHEAKLQADQHAHDEKMAQFAAKQQNNAPTAK